MAVCIVYMKKFFSLFVLLCTFFPASLSSAKDYFSDVTPYDRNYNAVQFLYEQGVIQGYPDGTFGINKAINRAELIKIIVNMRLTDAEKATLSSEYKNCFSDVHEEWFAPFVCYAKQKKWIDGYSDGTFRPAHNTNRAEAMKILLNGYYVENGIPELNDAEKGNLRMAMNVSEQDWFYPYYFFAFGKNIVDPLAMEISAGGSFVYDFSGNIYRKEVAETLHRLLRSEDTVLMEKENQLTGKWVFSTYTMINGIQVVDQLHVDIHFENGIVTGSFISTAIEDKNQSAVYITDGDLSGEYQKSDTSVVVKWKGSRDDDGVLALSYDPISASLLWKVTQYTHQDGLYTVPEHVKLYKSE